MGAPVAADRIVSSARATAMYLAEQVPPARRILVLGGAGLRRELQDVGLAVVDAREAAGLLAERVSEARRVGGPPIDPYEFAGRPDTVVVGLDPNLTYRTLAFAADAIRAGARFVATNRDPVYPSERGLRPGAGAIVAAVEATTGVTPVSIGKPAPFLLEEAARVVGAHAADAVMIGDGLLTDLAAARAVGARCVLMLTGVTTRAQLDALPEPGRPDAVAADAPELARALEAMAVGR
jgi:4-nitrophenyl phosphatase